MMDPSDFFTEEDYAAVVGRPIDHIGEAELRDLEGFKDSDED